MFKENFTIKKITFPNNVFYAPLSGLSDFSFRKTAGLFSPGLIFTEMVKTDAVIYKDPATMKMLKKVDHSLNAAQIFGNCAKKAKEAAFLIEDLGFDLIDLNCGCPVKKVVNTGCGSALLLYPEKIAEILHELISVLKIPVSLKIRIGWDANQISACQIVKLAEEAGAAFITIHGRTRNQFYSGDVDHSVIRECKTVARSLPVFGNGDVVDGPTAEEMFEKTSCDGIMIGRAALEKPWVVDEIRHWFLYKKSYPSSKEFIIENLKKHMNIIKSEDYGKKALINIKKICFWYLKKMDGVRLLRSFIMKSENIDEIYKLLDQF